MKSSDWKFLHTRACYEALLAGTETPAINSRTADLAPFWLSGSLPVTGKHSSLAASSGFPLCCGAVGFVCHCEDAISAAKGHCVAMCVANSSSGSIRPFFVRSGTAPRISGNICWEPRSSARLLQQLPWDTLRPRFRRSREKWSPARRNRFRFAQLVKADIDATGIPQYGLEWTAREDHV